MRNRVIGACVSLAALSTGWAANVLAQAAANHTFTNIGTVVATIVEVFGKGAVPGR